MRKMGFYEIVMEENDDIFNSELKYLKCGKVYSVKEMIKNKELIGKYFFESQTQREYFYLFRDEDKDYYELKIIVDMGYKFFSGIFECDNQYVFYFKEIDIDKKIIELWHCAKLYNLVENLSKRFVEKENG